MTAFPADVIVVGLGAMGGSAAYHLARRGCRVLGLDRFDPPHIHGSSHGDTRIIREAYFEHPVYVPLVRRAYELWAELEEEVSGTLYRKTGALLVGAPESAVVTGALASAREHGIPIDVLDSDRIGKRFPMFRGTEEMTGVLEHRAGVLDVEGCVAAHLIAAEERGAEIRTDERVTGWKTIEGGVEVKTERTRYQAGAVVLAPGPWVRELVPSLRVEVERQVVLWFAPRYAPASLAPPHCPVFLFDTPAGTFYGVPDLGRGVKAARHHGGETLGDTEMDGDLREEDAAPVVEFLERHLPAAVGELRRGSVCRYTNTPDGSFVIDRVPGEERVWVVSACSGHGFKFASAIGEAVAELVVGGRRDERIAPFCWPDQESPTA